MLDRSVVGKVAQGKVAEDTAVGRVEQGKVVKCMVVQDKVAQKK